MIFVFFGRRREPEIEVLGRGFFECRMCGVERSYQRWLLSSPRWIHVEPIGRVRSVEFVRCDACKNAFGLETLDAGCTKSARELLIHLEPAQLRARRH